MSDALANLSSDVAHTQTSAILDSLHAHARGRGDWALNAATLCVAFFRARGDLFPVPFPLLAPVEGPLTYYTDFRR